MRIDSGRETSVVLHPWNHAPRELPQAAYDSLHEWWMQTLRRTHARVTCPLTGEKLDVEERSLTDHINTSVTPGPSSSTHPRAAQPTGLASIFDVPGLSRWLLDHAPCGERHVPRPLAIGCSVYALFFAAELLHRLWLGKREAA